MTEDILDRIATRIQVFQPGGDNERLLLDAAEEIRQLRAHIAQLSDGIDQALNLIEKGTGR